MKMQISQKYTEIEDFIETIPYIFQTSGKVIHDSRNTIKIFHINGLVLNVKSFKIPIFINKIIYKYFRKSKAERSFEYAQRLINKGVNTPEPVAYIELSKNGLFARSYYISIHEFVDGTMKDIYKQSAGESKELIKSFTDFTAFLHKKQVFHKDYSPGNILYKKEEDKYEFYLVDLNRIRFKKINLFDSCKSFSRIRIDRKTQGLIAIEYAQKRNFNLYLCDLLISYYNRIFWKRHLQRHPENALVSNMNSMSYNNQ